MAQADTFAAPVRRRGQGSGVVRPGAQRLVRVRVTTDDGVWLGRLRLDAGRSALHELVGDDRAYLSLWDACREDLPGDAEEFLAVHKAAIRCVVVIGDDATAVLVN